MLKHRVLDIRPFCMITVVALLLFFAVSVTAQPRTEYRGFWVDTFNTSLNNHADIVTVVNNAKAAKANVLFVQVRRRGDSWYLNTIEPVTTEVAIQPGFDPLADILTEAHANGIEVHAFVIMAAIWGRSPQLFPPANPNHPFNLHGGYDRPTNTIIQGPNNWLTRTLIPDGTPGSAVTFQGHRIGSDFWFDFGHPDAEKYTVDVIDHLVRNYNIDGLHLDRIRYPEIGIAGQTPSTGTNIGYNPTSIERFNLHYGRTGNPAQNDPLWNQWRRDQVTNVVRRVYLNAMAVKPNLIVSGSLIAFGGIGSTEAAWNSAEANWRVYQDWRAWTEEGIIDIAIPMVYKAEHTATIRPQYDQWNAWMRNHLYGRAGMIGQGGLVNAVEGSLRQTRRTLIPAGGTPLSGITFFSMATSNIAVTANPFAVPSPINTPARPFNEFAAALTTGRSVNGLTMYEPADGTPVFAEPANIPVFPWKANPTKGHIMGFARRPDSSPLDTADVTITNLDTNAIRSGATDGGGFYGGVDLVPGQYLVKAVLGPDTLYSCVTNVTAGIVAAADLNIENVAPVTTAALDPADPNGSNDWYTTDVNLSLSANDNCSGVARTEYSTDGGNTWFPYGGTITVSNEGTTTVLYRSVDGAGNVENAGSKTIKIDKTNPTIRLTANPAFIWPPDGNTVTVTLNATGSDEIAGLFQATYVVTDEYGTPLSIPAHSLSGNSLVWTDTLKVEARRNGNDDDGRVYRIVATVADAAGNTSSATADVIVKHDQGNH